MAYRYQVNTSQGGGYAGNATVFEGRNECEAAARELAARWTAVRAWRVVETGDAVNYRFYRKLDKAVPLSQKERARRVAWKKLKADGGALTDEQCPVCGDYDGYGHIEDVASPCYGGG